MSSMYNAAPLCRKCHELGSINKNEVRLKLLDKAKAACDMAIIEGRIERNENDTTFIKHIIPSHIS